MIKGRIDKGMESGDAREQVWIDSFSKAFKDVGGRDEKEQGR